MTHVLHRVIAHDYPTAVSGKGIFIHDKTGKAYLDASGGAAVSCLGHSHPDVLDAMRAQLDKLQYAHTSFFTTQVAEELADDILRRMHRAVSDTSSMSAADPKRSRPRSNWPDSISSSVANRTVVISSPVGKAITASHLAR